MEKKIKGEATYDFVAPVVNIPENVRATLLGEELETLRATCLEQYAQAQIAFDQALGEVLESDPETLETARTLATRMIQLIDVDTEVEVKERVSESVISRLTAEGVTDATLIKAQINLAIELEKNSALSRIISQKTSRTEEVNIDPGNITEQGFHGMSPQSIRNVLKNGNLRELMYILFRTTDKYTKNLIADSSGKISPRMAQINAILQERHGWQVDVEFAAKMLEGQNQAERDRYGIYKPGIYHKSGEERSPRSPQEKQEYRRSNSPRRVSDTELSERENLVYTGEVGEAVEKRKDQELPWTPGAEVWKKKEKEVTAYSAAANATLQPFVASVSGTCDRTLTESILLGKGSREDLIKCRSACLGWLVAGRNHSVDEIMTSGKSFDLPYVPGPESYQYIDPDHPETIAAVAANLEKKGIKLPDYYLSEANVVRVLTLPATLEADAPMGSKPAEPEMIDLEAIHALGDITRILDESEQRKPAPEYSQRHITTLKAVSRWTAEEIVNHKTHNRLLQSDYSSLHPDSIITLAVTCKEDWLTDWVCPNLNPALKLNIAADLVVGYQVLAEDLNEITQNIYSWIKVHKSKELVVLESMINDVVSLSSDEIKSKALINMKNKNPSVDVDKIDLADKNDPNVKTLAAFIQVETQRKKKEVQHDLIRKLLQPMYPELSQLFKLAKKPTYQNGQNNDFSFLGAAGSGKSTVAGQLLPTDVKQECVVLATDDYRGVVMQDIPEKVQTDQVFIKTQDTAYCIKELVQQRLENNPNQRPNIVLDCMTLEGWHRKMLAGNASTTSVVACLDDISLVPSRAYLRAIDDKSGPADKGRQVNTTSLLSGHKDASERLLSSIPMGVITSLFDTNVPRGTQPKIFADIDLTGSKKEINVFNLTKLSNFVCKANVNVNAYFPEELYRDYTKGLYSFTFDGHHQAEQVLMMVRSKPHPTNPAWSKPAYDMKLTHNAQTYAKIFERDGKLGLEILNPMIFRDKWHENSPDANVLKSLVIQIHAGSLLNARANIDKAGSENQAAIIALSALDTAPAENKILQYIAPLDDIPPYNLNIMSVDKEPTLESLFERFGGRTKDNKIKQITVIPLLIKDDNDKIWIYGRSSDGRPKLSQIENADLYNSVSFPDVKDKTALLSASKDHQAIYNDIDNNKFHYYNYRVLQKDERLLRVRQHERYSAEFERQTKKMKRTNSPDDEPKTGERRTTPVVFTGAKLPEVEKDLLKDVIKVKPSDVGSTTPAATGDKTPLNKPTITPGDNNSSHKKGRS